MRHCFKSLKDAEKYFRTFDLAKLTEPEDFAIIAHLISTFKEMKSKLSEQSIAFWIELEKNLKAAMEKNNIFLLEVDDNNMEEAADILIKVLPREGLAKLLLQIDDFSAFPNDEINALWQEMSKETGKCAQALCERLSKERFRRNPNLN